jgi:PAC2 family
MNLITLVEDPPRLSDAVMVASFDGWVDAAEAASDAVAHIAEDGEVIATFDADAIFDYRSRRPVLDVEDGKLTELRWPELAIRHVRVSRRDLLVFSGAEPDLRWQELSREVADLVTRLGVSQWVSLGAVPGAVAHTRTVPLMTTASRDGLLTTGDTQGPNGLLRVPAAALSTFEMAVTERGTPAVGFFAQVPPYASIGYAAATVALLERLARHLGVEFDLEVLLEIEREQHARYDDAVSSDAMLRETVKRLESAAGDLEDEQLPTGDQLAREIERFLHKRDSEEGSD